MASLCRVASSTYSETKPGLVEDSTLGSLWIISLAAPHPGALAGQTHFGETEFGYESV